MEGGSLCLDSYEARICIYMHVCVRMHTYISMHVCVLALMVCMYVWMCLNASSKKCGGRFTFFQYIHDIHPYAYTIHIYMYSVSSVLQVSLVSKIARDSNWGMRFKNIESIWNVCIPPVTYVVILAADREHKIENRF